MPNTEHWLKDATILTVVHGSRAYGTNLPESDTDIRSICIPPMRYNLGFLHNFEQTASVRDGDTESLTFGIKKFFKLAADANPNALELLYVPEDCVRYISGAGTVLRDARDQFLSKKLKHTLSGYAHAQMKRIRNHKKWIDNPPVKPERSDFGLGEHNHVSTLIGKHLGQFPELAQLSDNAEGEAAFFKANREWEGYSSWVGNRNAARAAMEMKHGYDTKHGMHAVRLMRMCFEALTEGTLNVRREDAEELLLIRNGGWSYERFIGEITHLDLAIDEAYAGSDLPREPNRNELDKLCAELTEDYWRW